MTVRSFPAFGFGDAFGVVGGFVDVGVFFGPVGGVGFVVIVSAAVGVGETAGVGVPGVGITTSGDCVGSGVALGDGEGVTAAVGDGDGLTDAPVMYLE